VGAADRSSITARRPAAGVVRPESSTRAVRRHGQGAPGAALVAALAGLALACAFGGRSVGGEDADQLEANAAAHERLRFGLSKSEAVKWMGAAEIRPPWANSLGIGPQIVHNPLDSLRFESPSGEAYEVLRYAVALSGDPRCPFVRGDATLVPLIFVEGQLVGWRWSYLESALQRRLRDDERGWAFGRFCPELPEEG